MSFGFGTTPAQNAGASTGGGFSFGGTPVKTTGTVTGFGTTTGGATGLGGFGAGTAATTSTGLSLGSSTGFTLGGAPKTTAPTGLNLGGGFGTTTGTSTGLTLGVAKPQSLTLGIPTTTTASVSFNLGAGAAATTNATTGFTVGGATGTTAASTGFAPATAATASTGLTLGGGTGTGLTLGAGGLGGTGTGTGLTLGAGLGTGTAVTTKSGFGLGGGGLGLGGTTTSTGGSGLTLGSGLGGGLGGATAAATSVSTVSRGLGGVDPKTSVATTGASGTNGKPGDTKAVKETTMPNAISTTVKSFEDYVNKQKTVREEIARMSSKQMYKVQEEVTSLKQLLSLVTNGLQRNAFAIEKLKEESAQELKHAEIAVRTKDTPPGLQYENTAPTEYFHKMVYDFEGRMELYRQQIEEMESHLVSLNQPSMVTPQELTLLLSKLHESFVGLAAQLHVVHEMVKTQKEHYLNYRKVFHSDTTDIFERRRKAAEKSREGSVVTTTVGPTPFTGMSNAAAVAMATALNRAQQPQGGAPTIGLNTGIGVGGVGTLGQPSAFGTGTGTGLFGGTGTTGLGAGTTGLGTGLGTGTGFGTTGFGGTTTTQSSAFGTGGSSFGFGGQPSNLSSNTATVRPLGSTFGSTGSGLFGGSSTTGGNTAFGAGSTTGGTTGFGFGTPQQQQQQQQTAAGNTSAFGTQGFGNSTGFGTPQPAFGTPVAGAQPFQLQKPPMGNKRGKKT